MEQAIRDMENGDLGEPCPTSAAYCCPMAGRHLHKVVISPTTKRVALRPGGSVSPTASCYHFQAVASTGPHGHRLSEACRCRFPERDPGPAVRLCTCVLSFVRQCLCIKPSSLCLAVGKTPSIRRRLPIVPRVHDEPH